MRTDTKAILRTVLSVSMLVAAGLAAAQQITTVNLTAQRATAKLPDGKTVPMWNYCSTGVTNAITDGSAQLGTAVGSACSAAWAPGPTITVPSGGSLTINLNNTLPVPTSLVVLGQLGGGLGTPTRMPSPAHSGQASSTFVGQGPAGPFTPPTQADRVKSFGTEVGTGAAVALNWTNLKPGTYLYETGTMPSLQAPMGLYGVLVVTQAPVPVGTVVAGTPTTTFAAGIAYPGISYDSDATLLFSEIDPVQNAAVDAAAVDGANTSKRFNDPTCSPNSKCYPAAVNYAPTYFMINGQAFDKSNPGASSYAVGSAYSTGNVLMRFLNAGSDGMGNQQDAIRQVLGFPAPAA